MKKMFVVLLAVLLISCSNSGSSTATKNSNGNQTKTVASAPIHATYTPKQVLNLIQTKKDLLLIDVRSPQELKEGKLKNSVLIPFWNIMRGQYQIPHDRPIMLYCAVGGRSYGAMQILAKKGYPEVYNMKGGINEWKKEGLPVVY
jgi:rhodanese-related sulfurtransferase